MNKYSDSYLRAKSIDKMSEAERQLLLLEIGKAAEQIKTRYKGEANTLKGIAAMLNREAERIQEQSTPKPTPSPVRYGEDDDKPSYPKQPFNLFD
jgi:hypothetical protein